MRHFGILWAVLAALFIAGCGGDSIKSPTFTQILQAVTVQPSTASTPIGRTVQFTAVGEYTLPPGSATPTEQRPIEDGVQWAVGNTSIATIDQNGVATGVSPGSTQVTATIDGVSSTPATLNVGDAVVESIAITPANPTVSLGNTVVLSAIGTFSDGETGPVSVNWSSSNTGVATLAPATGPSTTATGVSQGGSTITASTVNADGDPVSATTTLTVGPFEPILLSLQVTPDPATQPVGRPQQFVATGTFSTAPGGGGTTTMPATVTWSTANSNVAIIDAQNGVATGQMIGSTLVTATAANGVSDSATFNVTAPVLDRIEITPPNPTVPVGANVTLFADGVLTNGASSPISVTWSSDNTTNATVIAGPATTTLASGLSVGTAVISATNGDVTGQTTLTVTDAEIVALDRVEPNPAGVAVGRSRVFTAIASLSDGNEAVFPNDEIMWSSSDPDIATIDANGRATGLVEGRVNITATRTETGETASALLVVNDGVCTIPLRAADGAVITPQLTPLCVLCSLEDGENIIDLNDDNFGTLNVPVGLLGNSAGARVRSLTTFEGGNNAGFIIGKPAGTLLLAEVTSQVQVRTLLDGVVQEDSSDGVALRVELLGLELLGGGETETALVGIRTSVPYDAIELSFNSGVASALSEVQVFQACGTAEFSPPASPLVGIDRIEPSTSIVAVDATRGLEAIGVFENGDEAPIPDADLIWESEDPANATVSPLGLVTGISPTTTPAVIRATLDPDVYPDIDVNNTAVGSVTVVGNVCETPFRSADGATIEGDTGGLCLLCSTSNLENVIDDLPNTAGTMATTVNLLGSVSVTVTKPPLAPNIMPVSGDNPGFVIGRPVGRVLLAELLAEFEVETLLDGEVQQSSDTEIPLRADLLGLSLTGDAELAVLTVNATQPYDSLRLTFQGLLSAGLQNDLSTAEVFRACSTTSLPN